MFWAELGWTSNRQSCGALDGCVPRTMVLDVDVGLGDGVSWSSRSLFPRRCALVDASSTSSSPSSPNKRPLLVVVHCQCSQAPTQTRKDDVSARVGVPNTDDSIKTSRRTSPSIHASTPPSGQPGEMEPVPMQRSRQTKDDLSHKSSRNPLPSPIPPNQH